MLTDDDLGRAVRDAWVCWTAEQPDPRPSWLVPYDELNEADKEADRRIGRAVRDAVLADLGQTMAKGAAYTLVARPYLAALEALASADAEYATAQAANTVSAAARRERVAKARRDRYEARAAVRHFEGRKVRP